MELRNLKMLARNFDIPTSKPLFELVALLTTKYTMLQKSQIIHGSNQITLLLRQYPHLSLTDIIYNNVVTQVTNDLQNNPNVELAFDRIIDWLTVIFQNQCEFVQHQINQGFTLAITELYKNHTIQQTWEIENTLFCVETMEELHIEKQCDICYEQCKQIDFVKTNCNHEFCHTCMKTHLNTQIQNVMQCCAMCRGEIKSLAIKCTEIHLDFEMCFANKK